MEMLIYLAHWGMTSLSSYTAIHRRLYVDMNRFGCLRQLTTIPQPLGNTPLVWFTVVVTRYEGPTQLFFNYLDAATQLNNINHLCLYFAQSRLQTGFNEELVGFPNRLHSLQVFVEFLDDWDAYPFVDDLVHSLPIMLELFIVTITNIPRRRDSILLLHLIGLSMGDEDTYRLDGDRLERVSVILTHATRSPLSRWFKKLASEVARNLRSRLCSPAHVRLRVDDHDF